MTRVRGVTAGVVAVVVALGSAAWGQEKSTEEQYAALAQARTKAELAVRTARDYLAKNEPGPRGATAAADRARGRAVDIYRRFIDQEQRKPENQRDLNAIDAAVQKASQVQIDWDDQTSKQTAGLEGAWREAGQAVNLAGQLYQNLTGMENSWKDGKFDLAPLQAAYEAVAKRLAEQAAGAQKAMAAAQAIQKEWEALQAEATKAAAPPKK